jgi:phosphonate transport system substrate-binding protein
MLHFNVWRWPGLWLFGLVLMSASVGRLDAGPSKEVRARTVRIGAVAYSPSAVTIFGDLRRYLDRNGMRADYTLYSNYDSLVEALDEGAVDIAWNTPLAHARYQRLCGNAGQTLVMRDVDCGFRSKLIVRKDAGIHRLADVHGKTLVLGSHDAAEATVLPVYFLKREGLDFDRLTVLSLDREVDLRGNPCSSELHVLKALQEGRGQAGVIGERLWRRLSAERPTECEALQDLWTSPPFSHCVFTARKGFDRALASRFTELMLSMKSDDPLTAELMRLEGTDEWVAGGDEGFETLLQALNEE